MGDRRRQFLDQALTCLRDGQHEEAVEFSRQAVEIDPSQADAATMLGVSLSNADQAYEAAEWLHRAADLEPRVAKHRYNLAAHHYRHGWKDEARAFARAALDLDASHKASSSLLARLDSESDLSASSHAFAPGASPPVVGKPSSYIPMHGISRPKHSLGAIERLGAWWDVALVAIFIVQLALLLVTLSGYIGGEATLEPGQSYGSAWFVVSWLAWIACWILDLVDRRPDASVVFMAVLAMVISSPMCVPLLIPVLGCVLFLVYMFVTRTARNRR